jgi:hypothetical protein
MSKKKTTSWAIRIRGSVGVDLPIPKMVLDIPRGWEFFMPGPEVKGMLLEIMNRRTGETGMFLFTGVGVGAGIGVADADLGGWTPFNTVNAITLQDFERTARLYNASIGLGINIGMGGIVFPGIEVYHDTFWQDFFRGDGIDIGGLSAGSGLDISEDGGYVKMVGHKETADADASSVLEDQPDGNPQHREPLYPTSLPDEDGSPSIKLEDALYPVSVPDADSFPSSTMQEDVLYPASQPDDDGVPVIEQESTLYEVSLPDDDGISMILQDDASYPTSLPDDDGISMTLQDDASYPISLPDDDGILAIEQEYSNAYNGIELPDNTTSPTGEEISDTSYNFSSLPSYFGNGGDQEVQEAPQPGGGL